MTKIAFRVLMCVCLVLTPAIARADDGGFWDMFFRWDTKFFGYGTEFHVLCLNKSGQRVENCEEWFRNLRHLFRPRNSQHFFTTFDGVTPDALDRTVRESPTTSSRPTIRSGTTRGGRRRSS
jgi:hypothetical protein